jgi:D-glycero-D-manno-heptose 1,7-bisphosphate phosphatase
MNKIVFLDRDGVINHDPGDYTYNLAEFHVLPDVLKGLKRLHELGYLLMIVTNQGGVAKGLYPLSEVERMHDYFQNLCLNEGFGIAEYWVSPHHESTGKSLSRKPGSLLIERGLAKYKADPRHCFMIGDKDRDIEAAKAAGVTGIKIQVNGSILTAVEQIAQSL